ncbi:MAG: DNA-binding response regulator [Chloroflexi bacterium]|nr:MAG: DNA-binding response regulator [Chloroflexota bacterium]
MDVAREESLDAPLILVVDDEQTTASTLRRTFELLGYRVREARSGEEALLRLREESFDLVLLDLRMPGLGGLEVLREARHLAPNTPFVILTAHASLESAILALRRGACDYLQKPCDLDEIVQAVRRGLAQRERHRRQLQLVRMLREVLADLGERDGPAPSSWIQKDGSHWLVAGPCRLDLHRRRALLDDRPLDLSPTEFDLLAYLARHPEQPLTLEELAGHLYGTEMDVEQALSSLRMHVYRLRRKIEPDPRHPRYLRTVRGVGYMLVNEP